MSGVECPREQDVLDAIASRRWPDRLPEELASHLRACEACADLAEVAGALRDDYDEAWGRARVPSAGVVWWRAEMRARAEAARVVSRPLLAIQVLAPLCVLAAAASWVFAGGGTAAVGWLDAWRDVASLAASGVTVEELSGVRAVLIFALASVLVLPAALYFALRGD